MSAEGDLGKSLQTLSVTEEDPYSSCRYQKSAQSAALYSKRAEPVPQAGQHWMPVRRSPPIQEIQTIPKRHSLSDQGDPAASLFLLIFWPDPDRYRQNQDSWCKLNRFLLDKHNPFSKLDHIFLGFQLIFILSSQGFIQTQILLHSADKSDVRLVQGLNILF